MKFKTSDFEFYTFFLGLRQKELELFRLLLKSFPHFSSHKLNVIDQSGVVRRWAESGDSRFDMTWRGSAENITRDLDDEACEATFAEYADRINRIPAQKRLFHGQAIDMVMNELCSHRFTVIMDTDVEFVSDRYLPELTGICDRYEYEDLAAVGSIVQEAPFHLTLSRDPDPDFYDLFMTSRTRHIDWQAVQKAAASHSLPTNTSRAGLPPRGRVPRLHPALLMINRDIFRDHKMTFRHLYFDVLDIRAGAEHRYRAIGDNGASFFFQCGLAGKEIANIDINEYVIHHEAGSRTDPNATEHGQPMPNRTAAARTSEALASHLIEAHVRNRWTRARELPHTGPGPARIAVFGAGSHTSWLERVTAGTSGPEVVAVLDDTPRPDRTFWNLPSCNPTEWEPSGADAIMLSSDILTAQMTIRCRELYGTNVTLLNIYEDLPPGPYPKSQP